MTVPSTTSSSPSTGPGRSDSTQAPTNELLDDPLWHKDAIIYELHIRAFKDTSNDGVGDIPGLIEKLDYLCDLGVTAVWLLPFYPSPLRDGGYDIADYTSVHESYGTRRDFARLLREAHRRGLRVITELVLNHTSSEHPWFQRARRAPKGSKHRDFYVWSDTPSRYEETRIIFKDFETSNWSWDPVAKAYYWHRFYAHQPDLNFDNPAVHEALFEVVDFWMEMGVDGMRLDAVPYLYEREGTNCENLPETHAFLRKLRAHVDERYKNRVLLAEANQWPADAAAYFGSGDECHMNFHFPLMPRMFMAVELEDSFPIVNILQQTPKIPENCQWATFLRNHDELTLEMVTDEDRDTMWRAYASERTARINLGIRRRLAPLMKTRAKIELMNALLLSLPGTPVLYYGDEIGMGDNIYLGDRDGVRTPMQWSSDRNAGFSRANAQRLYLPPIIDSEFHFEAVNVEAQQNNSDSLLWWTKRIIAKRKEHKVFGRGSIEFLQTDNSRVLAFVREYEHEAILVVANLSRFVQCVEIELARFEGVTPHEIFGRTKFPQVTRAPYFLSLGAHSFYWLSLERPSMGAPVSLRPAVVVRGEPSTLFSQRASRDLIARALLHYIGDCRWFRSKARARKGAEILDVFGAAELGGTRFIVLLRVEYSEGAPETYVIPMALMTGAQAHATAAAVIASVRIESAAGTNGGKVTEAVLVEALGDVELGKLLLSTMRGRKTINGEVGQLLGIPFRALREVSPEEDLMPRIATSEQSNSSLIYGGRFLLKVFRAIDEGPNPEFELGRYLTHQNFKHTTRMAGGLEYRRAGQDSSTVGALFEYLPNQGDGWRHTLDSLYRFFDRVLADPALSPPPISPRSIVERSETPLEPRVRDWIGPYLDNVRLLGRRTAELHHLLASEDRDPAFVPEPFDMMYQQSLYQSAHALTARTWRALRKHEASLPASTRTLVEKLLPRQPELDRAFATITSRRFELNRIRIHGDLHLGQLLWTGDDFAIIDFEGEPYRPLSQRRFKRCPLRDVAGMIRSFHYAGSAALRSGKPRHEDLAALERWVAAWAEWVSGEFVHAYLEAATGAAFLPKDPEHLPILMRYYLTEKCVYEIAYELNNRPDWLEIPVRDLLGILDRPE
jgi:maltose alpha-D-glucosyltransferase/alpha-amylase